MFIVSLIVNVRNFSPYRSVLYLFSDQLCACRSNSTSSVRLELDHS
jgi:hypothetical protein